ncbi:hypothetical protein BH10PAT3_BH10PAT3_5330 [soil metagenome]
MSSFEAPGSGSAYELPRQTLTFFNALAHLSAQPGGVGDLPARVEQMAEHPATASAFEPIQRFNAAFNLWGFDTATDLLNVFKPQGLPVDIIKYDETGNHEVMPGEIVALLDVHPVDHAAFTGLAVTDLGHGPEVIDVAWHAGVPGIVYLSE